MEFPLAIGASFPAFRVNLASGESHKLSIKFKASAASSDGFYVRLYEYDSALPDGKLVISNSATNTLAQEDTRRVGNWKENQAITTESGTNGNWNLVGNPYPSFLNLTDDSVMLLTIF